jgi:hypothetical protein
MNEEKTDSPLPAPPQAPHQPPIESSYPDLAVLIGNLTESNVAFRISRASVWLARLLARELSLVVPSVMCDVRRERPLTWRAGHSYTLSRGNLILVMREKGVTRTFGQTDVGNEEIHGVGVCSGLANGFG